MPETQDPRSIFPWRNTAALVCVAMLLAWGFAAGAEEAELYTPSFIPETMPRYSNELFKEQLRPHSGRVLQQILPGLFPWMVWSAKRVP